MNHRLNVLGWKSGKDPDQDTADHLSSYHYSKYTEAYFDFLREIGAGMDRGHAQMMLVDLDNRSDWVIVHGSRWEVE